jgi:tetratricopeptide (TPR) repeat protein
MKDFRAAYNDFNAAFRLRRNGVAKACEGYCLSQIRYHKDAITACRLALESGFDRPALLYNNIGYSYLMLGQLADAERSFQRAIDFDDGLFAPHYNLVILSLQRAAQGAPIFKMALVHAAKAIQIGPPTADLYHVVSSLYATAAQRDRTLIPAAIKHVARAIELGSSPETFASDVCFSAIKNEPAFHEALKRATPGMTPARAEQLIDPLEGP